MIESDRPFLLSFARTGTTRGLSVFRRRPHHSDPGPSIEPTRLSHGSGRMRSFFIQRDAPLALWKILQEEQGGTAAW